MDYDQKDNLPEKPVAWWHWHRRLYDWVVHWADTRFGTLALIILAVTEPICVPIPADVLVIGLCFGRPKRSLRYGLICSLFSVLGGTIAFSLGLAIGGENVVGLFNTIGFGEKAQLALDFGNGVLGIVQEKYLMVTME